MGRGIMGGGVGRGSYAVGIRVSVRLGMGENLNGLMEVGFWGKGGLGGGGGGGLMGVGG